MDGAHAVSRAVSVAVQEYYRRAGPGRRAEPVGRLFEQWLGHFRRMVWSCDTEAELLQTIQALLTDLCRRVLQPNDRTCPVPGLAPTTFHGYKTGRRRPGGGLI